MAPKEAKDPPSREGLVALTHWTKPETRQALKLIAVENGETMQRLYEEALLDLIVKYRKRRKG